MKNSTKEEMPDCDFKGKFDKCRDYHKCNHKDKSPGFRLCIQIKTCPFEIKDGE